MVYDSVNSAQRNTDGFGVQAFEQDQDDECLNEIRMMGS
jgi:hypothetical protein